MPQGGNMKKNAKLLFPGLTFEETMGVLMRRHGKPAPVARDLKVYEGAVRSWIKGHGWRFDENEGIWVAPEKEAQP